MEYKVKPFRGGITRNDSSATVAEQLQQIIDKGASEGWEYVSMESVETNVAPTSGCFGFGGQPGFIMSFQVLVFKRA